MLGTWETRGGQNRSGASKGLDSYVRVHTFQYSTSTWTERELRGAAPAYRCWSCHSKHVKEGVDSVLTQD